MLLDRILWGKGVGRYVSRYVGRYVGRYVRVAGGKCDETFVPLEWHFSFFGEALGRLHSFYNIHTFTPALLMR